MRRIRVSDRAATFLVGGVGAGMLVAVIVSAPVAGLIIGVMVLSSVTCQPVGD